MNSILCALFLCCAVSLSAQERKIDLGGVWKFSPDTDYPQAATSWYTPAFDDSAWQELRAGEGWKQQGVAHAGFGWYRKRIDIPEAFRGMPLTVRFGEICYDDDVYFNGVRVGGLHGPYKYRNLARREYTVPDSLIRFGEENTLAVRAWGMLGVGVEGDRYGLAQGPFEAVFDPMQILFRRTDLPGSVACAPQAFDLSDAQQGMTFEIEIPLDPATVKGRSKVAYRLSDFYDTEFWQAEAAIGADGSAVITVDREMARRIYLAGCLCVTTQVHDAAGNLLFRRADSLERFSYARRDEKQLPDTYANIFHETPYGKLRLVDEIDCSQEVASDSHPYMQSGYDARQRYRTPGSPVEVSVSEILGRKARESTYGWFAYRIGRGQLRPHTQYLLRVEYPEDKPRYCPLEIQTGENYQNVAWKSGISADNPYDNWPLSGNWEWFDTILPLDDETTGTSGANGASSEHGIWVYVMNKCNPPLYFPLHAGGPAVARIRLYELQTTDAPVIRYPDHSPRRVLMLDWERQPLMDPADMVGYARLMGYNAVSPLALKWAMANYADPVPGYDTYNADAQGYWDNTPTPPGGVPSIAVPGRKSIHARYLEATAQAGMGYLPRIEYGGSEELPLKARAVNAQGQAAKPNRFAAWCGDLLHPETYADFARLLDSAVGKYAAKNPQLLGILWRIRSDRMPISYSRWDVALFARETGVTPPEELSDVELARWASTGDVAERYTDWWHEKRAEFQGRIARLLAGYNPEMRLWYYNWDNDKFSLGMCDFTGWDFLGNASRLAATDPQAALRLYKENIERRRRYTSEEYLRMMRSGDLGVKSQGYLPHHGLRPWLYRNIPGVELFAPVNACYTASDSVFLNYFRTKEGLAVSNPVVYDEVASRHINPKYEGNMAVPGGASFSMALEVLACFHGDPRTLTFTSYTYARGFAAAHRRFAQAFLALPATQGRKLPVADADLCVRTYRTAEGTYVGVVSKSYTPKALRVTIPSTELPSGKLLVTDRVSGRSIPAEHSDQGLAFDVACEAMSLGAYLIQVKNANN